jgi:hypothetical protein
LGARRRVKLSPFAELHFRCNGSSNKGFEMNRGIAVALLVGGIVLAIFGISAADSFSSDVSRFFNGKPTDEAMWMLIGGAAAAAIGLFGLIRRGKA